MSKPTGEGLTYHQVGDNYAQKDPIKALLIKIAAGTADNIADLGFTEVPESRGESAYVVDMGPFYLSTAPEGLGTKNLIADAMDHTRPERSFYYEAAQCAVASIVNDLLTNGSRPFIVNAHWAIGSNDWLNNEQRMMDLGNGWAEGCRQAGATYGGGETATLRGIVNPDTIELSGSGIGIIQPKERYTLGERMTAGDKIMLIGSSGIHCNGVSLAREISTRLPDGYMHRLPSGRTFGEALLTPTFIYAKLQDALFRARVDIHYMAHITGHGWSKLMRYDDHDFTYRMHSVPPLQEEFQLIQQYGELTTAEMYKTFNSGAGFAFMVSPQFAELVQHLSALQGFFCLDAGVVEEGPRQVIIEPHGIILGEETMTLK